MSTKSFGPKRTQGSLATRVWRWLRVGAASLGLAAIVAGTGCAAHSVTKSAELRTTAIADLECSNQQLQIQQVDFSTAGVAGCGRNATYRWNNQYATWVLKESSSLDQRSARLSE